MNGNIALLSFRCNVVNDRRPPARKTRSPEM
jgi:hypothetical protein